MSPIAIKLSIARFLFAYDHTLGVLRVGAEPFCFTLEDAVRPVKIRGSTAIAAGEYVVTLERSPRFGVELPRLHGVPDFEGVLIHGGNGPEDTEGCVLIGDALVLGRIVPGTSRPALARLVCLLRGAKSIMLDIA